MDDFTNDEMFFDDIVTDSLLIELVNKNQAEVFENVVFQGKRRYYIEDLTQRDYSLENTTPYQLELAGRVIETSSWGVLLCRTAELLLELYPSLRDRIFDFRCPWSKAAMFTPTQKVNSKMVVDGVYVNCNHTALHSCWFLQDLLDFFDVDKSTVGLLIHRPSSAEPKSVKEYIEKRFKRDFIHYICTYYDKTEEFATKAVNNIDKYLNPILRSMSRSYTNFFLFDNNSTMLNYVKKVREKITNDLRFDAKVKKIIDKYLDYLVEFYKE